MKRLLDLLGSACGLLLLTPVMAGVAVLVWRDVGRPVLFRQPRPGRGGKVFLLRKFRTMRGGPGTDAERLTPLGRWLRATSLDELPELWNVLVGDMSLVGPRPLLVQYLERYSPEQARRHEVRPGLTGWAQVHGRNATTWEERLALDVWYVDHRSFWLDLRILARTVGLVLGRKGVSAPGEATMGEFRGSGALRAVGSRGSGVGGAGASGSRESGVGSPADP